MPCILKIDQATLSPPGVPGFSRSDGLAGGQLVTITNTGGGSTFDVELLFVPPDDTTAVASLVRTGANTWTFSPTAGARGRYRIRGIVDAGLGVSESESIHTFGIRFAASGLCLPAANELADPTTTLATSGNAAKIAASETNEPSEGYAGGTPFGYYPDLRGLFMQVETLSAATPVARKWEDFARDVSGWLVTTVLSGEVTLSPSLSATGFPSSGVAILSVSTTTNSFAEIYAPSAGAILGPATPISIEYRIGTSPPTVPEGSLATFSFGIVGVVAAGPITDSLMIVIEQTSSGTTTYLRSLVASAGTNEAFTLPAGSYFNFRITVSETGTKVEISADDGPFATVLNGVVHPTHTVYIASASAENTTLSGSGSLAIDFVDWSPDRLAPDAGTFVPYFIPFPVPFPGFGTSGTTAAVGNDSRFTQPQGRSVGGTTDTLGGTDLGGVVLYGDNCTVTLPSLAASMAAASAGILTLQETSAGKVITVHPTGGTTIDGSASDYVAATGRARVSLISENGIDWYSGTP